MIIISALERVLQVFEGFEGEVSIKVKNGIITLLVTSEGKHLFSIGCTIDDTTENSKFTLIEDNAIISIERAKIIEFVKEMITK